MHMVTCIFQLVICWPWCIPVLSLHLWRQGIERRLLNVNHSLVVLIFLFFMLLVDLQKRLIRTRLWDRKCDLYVKKCFLPAIPHSSRRNVQPCIVRCKDFSFTFVCIYWQKCGFYLNISTDLSLSEPHSPTDLCLIESLKCNCLLSIKGCDPQSLSLHQHSEWICPLLPIHMLCRWHPWILVYLVHIQSL